MKKVLAKVLTFSLLVTMLFISKVTASQTYHLAFYPDESDFTYVESGMTSTGISAPNANGYAVYKSTDVVIGSSVVFTTKQDIPAGDYSVSIDARTNTQGRARFNVTMCSQTAEFDSNLPYSPSTTINLFDSVTVSQTGKVSVAFNATTAGIVYLIQLNLVPVEGNTTTNTSSAPATGWNIMFDWENESNTQGDPVISTTVAAGANKAVNVRNLESYNNNNYTLLEGSTKAIWIYNDLNQSGASNCSPLNNSTPATVELNSLENATDLRVNLHIKQKNYTISNMFIGFVMNGNTYYAPLTKSDYYCANYYNFVGKTFTQVGSNSTVTVTASNVSDITKIAGWVQTNGYEALLIDNIEYYGPVNSQPTPTEPTTASNDVTVYTMDSDSRPIAKGVVYRGALASYADCGDSDYGNTIRYQVNNGSVNMFDQIAYFAFASNCYTSATPISLSFDVKTDDGVAAFSSFRTFAYSDSSSSLSSNYNSGISLNLGNSFNSTWTTKEIDLSSPSGQTIVNNGYGAFGFKLKSSGTTASYIYIDNVTITYEVSSANTTKDIQYYRDNLNLDWSEEFNGNSLNTTDWNYQPESKHRNNQESAYKPANVQIIDGKLVLTARKETVTCGCDNMTEQQHQAKYNHSKTYRYTAGGVDTQGKKLFRHGMIETRVNCPEGSGTWCSVWMCGVDSSGNPHWPFTGEIDIIEYAGRKPTEEFSTLHYTPTTYYEGISSYVKKSAGGQTYTLPTGKFSSGYHTIGMMWTEKSVDFYVDDYVYQSIDTTLPEFYAFRDYDFYFLITFPLGGSVAGGINDSILPQSFSVDYIRCYQPYEAVAQNVTSNSVTLQAREGYQFSKDGTNWQSSNVFTDLTPDTDYTFYQRMAQTEVFSRATNKSHGVVIRTYS